MTAITTRTEPCWTLIHADGRPAGFEDSEPHFDSKADALKAAPTYGDVDIPDPTPKVLAGLCSTATLACGYCYDENGEGVEHWDSADQLRTHLLNEGYRPGENGSLRCPAGHDCDECDGLPDAPDYTPLPGQFALIPEETR